jgi:hypothetical protein
MFRATSEPIVVTATLLAIECHLAGWQTAAFLSGVALVLMRPGVSLAPDTWRSRDPAGAA